MRDIKFRGKRIDNGEWIYGSLLDGDIIVAGTVDADGEYIGVGEWSSVYPETVGQYTGLKDKSGKEIYEGDIVLFRDGVDMFYHLVNWSLVDGSYIFKCLGDNYMAQDMEFDRCEVIGNRFDNPDLLGEVRE